MGEKNLDGPDPFCFLSLRESAPFLSYRRVGAFLGCSLGETEEQRDRNYQKKSPD
jgi:hypothetical protein